MWSAEETRYIIFDTAERLRGMDATLLTALLRLPQVRWRADDEEEKGGGGRGGKVEGVGFRA